MPKATTTTATIMKGGAQVARAAKQLRHMLLDLVTDAAATGDVHDDIVPDKPVTYGLSALTAGSSLPSKGAVHSLVKITLELRTGG